MENDYSSVQENIILTPLENSGRLETQVRPHDKLEAEQKNLSKIMNVPSPRNEPMEAVVIDMS